MEAGPASRWQLRLLILLPVCLSTQCPPPLPILAIKMSPLPGKVCPPDTPVGGGLKQLHPCSWRSRGNVSNWLLFVGGLISVLLSWITWK